MAEIKKKCYKYCIVPMCLSTTVKNPNKLFFHVPNDLNQRKKWCKSMRRDLIGPKTTSYVCEDHFDVENDTENLVKYRLVGGTLKLKVNSCPHKFDCQKEVKLEKQQGACEKRLRIENIITKEVSSTSSPATSVQSFEMIECDKMEFNETEDLETEDPLPEDITSTESVRSVNACFENSDSSMAYLAMDWSSDFTLQFLKLYRNERCLWDPLDEHYKRREYVTGAWHRLVESTGKPLAELKRKRESLMATFRGHSRRKKASMMEGAEGSAVYQPVWFAFNLMESFLGEVYGIQNTNDVNTADVETSDSTDLPHQEEYDYFSSVAPTPSRAVATPPPNHQHPAKRRRTTIEPRDTEHVVTEIYTLLNSVLAKKEEEEDECEMYCKIMVKRLRKIPEQERQQLMHDMDGMVLKAMFRARNDEANSSNSYSMEPSTSMRSSRGHRNLRNEEDVEIDSKADIVLFEEGDR